LIHVKVSARALRDGWPCTTEDAMSIKTILVPLAGVAGDRQLLDLALTGAKPSSAHILAQVTRPDPRALLAYVSGVDADASTMRRIMDEVEADGIAASKRARETFEHWCAQNDLSVVEKPEASPRMTAGWVERVGRADETITRAGGTADLIVLPGAPQARDQAELEAALFATGRPVLLAPGAPMTDLFSSAIIAWNGSPESNRAVAAALPLLSTCGRVGVFCEPESKRAEASADELTTYLAWHGITAARVPAGTARGSIAEKLFDTALRVHASLVVMGAYTHGRMRQMVFGGVTSQVLGHATIPVLLAH
jgi:nucleotide-binding universal stress UspA family protein